MYLPTSLPLSLSLSPPLSSSQVSRTAEIAEALQNRLDAYKAEKSQLGNVNQSFPSSSPSLPPPVPLFLSFCTPCFILAPHRPQRSTSLS